MKVREFALLLLLGVVAFAARKPLADGAGAAIARVLAPSPPPALEWRYDERSRYHGAVPASVQSFTSKRPFDVADAVCRSLGGRADFIQPDENSRDRIGFNCAFEEHGEWITADFGDLRRIATDSLRSAP